MKMILLISALLVHMLSSAQALRAANSNPTFGRHGCLSGRGLCGFTTNPPKAKHIPATYFKNMSEHSFILTISRKSLVPEDEIRIAGKPFSQIAADEQLLFVQHETLLVSKLSLQHLDLDSNTNKIYPGNYPMFLSNDKVEILFTLRN